MKPILLFLLFCLSLMQAYSQENRYRYIPEKDENDIATFMNMMGFDYHKFEIKSPRTAYVNVYIDEYLNDELINSYDHISANKDEAPKAYFDIIFTKLDTSKFILKLYTLSKSDSVEQVQFRIGELGLFKKLKVNKKEFDYSWKLTNFSDNIGPQVRVNVKTPLLYYSTAVEENVNEQTVSAFCNVPNILNNRELIENIGKIKHFFEIGIELVDKID